MAPSAAAGDEGGEGDELIVPDEYIIPKVFLLMLNNTK